MDTWTLDFPVLSNRHKRQLSSKQKTDAVVLVVILVVVARSTNLTSRQCAHSLLSLKESQESDIVLTFTESSQCEILKVLWNCDRVGHEAKV